MSGFIIKLTDRGNIEKVAYPDGGLREQNIFFLEQIGEKCDIFERVKPRRLYTEWGCVSWPDPNKPGVAVSILIDEEGLYHDLDVNVIASYLYQADQHGCPIVGNVLFVGERYTDDGDIEFCAIEEHTLQTLYKRLADCRERTKRYQAERQLFKLAKE